MYMYIYIFTYIYIYIPYWPFPIGYSLLAFLNVLCIVWATTKDDDSWLQRAKSEALQLRSGLASCQLELQKAAAAETGHLQLEAQLL